MPGVLTKKQCWRRQVVNTRRNQVSNLPCYDGNGVQRSVSESALSLGSSSASGKLLGRGKPWATTGDLQESTCRSDALTSSAPSGMNGRRKSVMFSARVHVVLIPCVSEYEAAGLSSMMWWTDDDYKLFKQYALEEVKEFMLRSKITDSKEAIKQLYQHMPLIAVSVTVSARAETDCTKQRSSDTNSSKSSVGEICSAASCIENGNAELEPSSECKSEIGVDELRRPCEGDKAPCSLPLTSQEKPTSSFSHVPIFIKSPALNTKPVGAETASHLALNGHMHNDQIHPLALICS